MKAVESLKPWSGTATGAFHIDYLGVKTDPQFWKGLKPTRAGRVRVSPPALSDTYFEYAACIMAASAVMRPFQVLEIGAGWGVWSVRAALVARHLQLPVRSIAIEMMPEQRRNISRHFMANGLNPLCHEIVAAALAPERGIGWARASGPADPGARLMQEDWVMRNAVVPMAGLPLDMPLPCRDGTEVTRLRTQRLQDVVAPGTPLDFVHLRIGPGPQRLLADPVLDPAHVGVLVLPGIAAADVAPLEQKLEALGYDRLFGLDAGQVLRGARGEVKVNNALRIYAGERIPRYRAAEMAERLAAIAGAAA